MRNKLLIISTLLVFFLIFSYQQALATNGLIKISTESVKELDYRELEYKTAKSNYQNHINSLRKNTYSPYQEHAELTMDDIAEWFNRKLFEIVHFLQVLSQPFTIVIFILSAFLLLIGSMGRGDLVGKGMFGLVMSPVTYALILYSPMILTGFMAWLAN